MSFLGCLTRKHWKYKTLKNKVKFSKNVYMMVSQEHNLGEPGATRMQ